MSSYAYNDKNADCEKTKPKSLMVMDQKKFE